jgi:hypothetical protein
LYMSLLIFLGILLLVIPSLFPLFYLSDQSTFLIPPVYAQQTGSSSSPLPPQEIGVKITSPSAGNSVPIGQKQGPQLEVSGTSTDNSITDCQVSVIVNNVKPYQQVRANGSGGVNDFSSWNFLLNSSYTTIKEGPNNKITSKIICHPKLTKWYSVNVTGVLSNASILNITSPSAFEQISAGRTITVYGTSVDDFYKDCEVYVRKNNHPFQKATAAGLTGARDYSFWKFNFIDNSSIITPGNTNIITAKLLCNDKTSLADPVFTSSHKNSTESIDGTAYATVDVVVVGTNEAPTAKAKASEKETKEGEEVTLDGEDSTDPNGDSLAYLWKQTDGLDDEKVSIIGADKGVAKFKVPDNLIQDTTFEFTLTVADRYGETGTDTVSIEAKANSEPVADAGGNKEAVIHEQVTLDGTDTHDPDPNGEIVSYEWEQSDGPAVSLQGSDQPVARFSVPFIEEDSTFEFTLTVTDNENAQDTDKVGVEVEAPPSPQLPDEAGEICFDGIDNNDNGLVDEECEFD